MYAYEWDISTDKVVRSMECVDILGKDEPTQTTRRESMLAGFVRLRTHF